MALSRQGCGGQTPCAVPAGRACMSLSAPLPPPSPSAHVGPCLVPTRIPSPTAQHAVWVRAARPERARRAGSLQGAIRQVATARAAAPGGLWAAGLPCGGLLPDYTKAQGAGEQAAGEEQSEPQCVFDASCSESASRQLAASAWADGPLQVDRMKLLGPLGVTGTEFAQVGCPAGCPRCTCHPASARTRHGSP